MSEESVLRFCWRCRAHQPDTTCLMRPGETADINPLWICRACWEAVGETEGWLTAETLKAEEPKPVVGFDKEEAARRFEFAVRRDAGRRYL